MRFSPLIALVLLLSGCAGGDVAQPVIDAPEGDPIRGQLEWFADALNAGDASEEDYEERFTDEFRARVPFREAFLPVLSEMSGVAGEWRLAGLDLLTTTTGQGLIAAAGERMQVDVEVEADPPYRVVDLRVRPVMLSAPPADYEGVVNPLRRYGRVGFLVAGVEGGRCAPDFEVGVEETFPIAGAVSLFVALAVAEEVQDASLRWDTAVEVRDELRSHPDGVLSLVDDGAKLAVGELLEAAIADGDTTALDHLIETLGRERIERVFDDRDTADPNTPFLTSREMAALKIGSDSGALDRFAAAGPDERREILAGLTGDVSRPVLPERPAAVDAVEWFATPTELCEAMVELDDLAYRPGMEPLLKALSAAPGLVPPPERFERVLFAGGSEPGALAVVWLTEDVGGERRVTVGTVTNPDISFPTIEPTLYFGAGRDL